MVYSLIVKPLAEQDVRDAVEWYLGRNESLPKKLIQKITECFERIQSNPIPNIIRKDTMK